MKQEIASDYEFNKFKPQHQPNTFHYFEYSILHKDLGKAWCKGLEIVVIESLCPHAFFITWDNHKGTIDIFLNEILWCKYITVKVLRGVYFLFSLFRTEQNFSKILYGVHEKKMSMNACFGHT